jgi:hypothetical protein
MIYPISFSIFESKIVSEVPVKKKLLAHVIPDLKKTYIFQEEKDYYKDYQESAICLTFKKNGWDCFRHYEILANGSIPYFHGISDCPSNIMTHLPKQLILEAMNQIHYFIELPEEVIEYLKKSESNFNFKSNHDRDNIEPQKFKTFEETIQYYSKKLLDYTREHLTNKEMAKYILKYTNKTNVKSILFIAGDGKEDYMMNNTLTGFKQLLGKECHETPHIPYMYTDFPNENVKYLYGNGFTFSQLLEKERFYDEMKEKTLEQDIRNHRYDIVVYGSIHRGKHFHTLVTQHYSNDDIIYICGEDTHQCEYKNNPEYTHFFLRESD